MFYRTPKSSSSQRNSGFTLIELLMVIGVIVILTAITFGVFAGVKNAQARAKAVSELAALSQAIEEYKARYGDYPIHDSNTGDYPGGSGEVTSSMLLYALTGRIEVQRQSNGNPTITKIADSLDDPSVEKRPKFIDVEKFTYDGAPNSPEVLLDPWGNPYVYWYKWEDTQDNWDVFGYHLYSMGPNGQDANAEIKTKITETTGVLDNDFRETADAAGIIFAGE